MGPERVVIQTKLTPPRPNRRTLERPRLTRQLQQVLDYKLTILHAGAGYGKSTALTQLTRSEAALVWYHIDAEDSDPQVFLSYLLHGFNAAIEAVADRALDLLRDMRPGWSHVLDTLINDMVRLTEQPILLILDDAHLLNQTEASLLLLERLLKHAPPNLHIVLALRQMPRLDDLVVWRVRGEILMLAEEDLAFTPAEIVRLFSERYKLELSEEDARTLHRHTQGWAIALQLIWQGLDDNADIHEALAQLKGGTSELFAYLAQDVVNQLPEHIRTFLRTSSVLRTMTPAICNCLFEHERSAAILAELVEASVFVQSLDGDAVRYHPLFHEFLYQTLTGDEARTAHLRAAGCYQRFGSPEEAVAHLLRAEATGKAAKSIAGLGQEMINAGRLETLASWIGQLPPEALNVEPMLLVYRGDIERLHSRFDEARYHYARAEEHFRQREEPRGTAHALRGQARVYLDTVNPSRAHKYLEEALALTDAFPEERDFRANLLELMAENHINRGNSDEANVLQAQAIALRQEGVGETELAVRALLRTGRLSEARRILEARAADERLKPVSRPRAHRETLLLLALILAFEGEAEAALSAAREGTRRGHMLEAPFVTAVGMMRQGHALLIQGDEHTSAAREMFEEAVAYSERLEVDRLKPEAFWGLCGAHGRRGELTAARSYAEQGVAIAQEAGDDWITAHIRLTLGAAYAVNGEPEEAIKWVNAAAEGFAACGDTYGQAAAGLWQCSLTPGAERLEAVFRLVKAYGYDYLLTLRTLLGPPDPVHFVPVLLAAREAGIRHAERLLSQLGLAGIETHPGYRLRVQMLGAFTLWRGTEKVGPGDWPREKARQMFQIFITERHQLLDRERIYGLLWPDLDAESAGRSFRVTLNTLYRVLEPNRKAGAPSAYIVRESSLYGLRPEADIALDVAAFEKAVKAGDAAFSSDPSASLVHYRRALTIYQGDYCAEYLYEEWLRDERIRLRAMFMRTAERVARTLIEREQWDDALAVCARIISADNCWESAYRLSMLAYAGAGNRAQALRTFHRLEQTLLNELDTVPSEETTALYKQLSAPV